MKRPQLIWLQLPQHTIWPSLRPPRLGQVVAWLVLMIVATVKVANHEEYRYPAIIRFIS